MELRVVMFGVWTAAIVAAPAAASPIDLAFHGSGLQQSVVVHRGSASPGASTGAGARMVAGSNAWQVVNGDVLAVGTHMSLFTPSLSGFPTSGSAVVSALLASTHLEGGKAAARGGVLRNLYSVAHAESVVSDLQAAAFQVAIWEITHEGGFDPWATAFEGAGLDTGDGASDDGFWIGSGRYGERDPVAALANQWLGEAWQRWHLGSGGAPLVVLAGEGFQEQLMLMPIPLPSAGGLAAAGVLLIGTRRRRPESRRL